MDFEEILKQQVQEQRASRPITPKRITTPESPSRPTLKKNVLIPIDSPEQEKVDIETDKPKFPIKEPPPRVTQRSEMSIQHDEPEPPKQGGALWGPPPDEMSLRKSYQNAIKEMREQHKPTLFELAMQEPPKPPERTLYTYYDILAQKK